MQFIREISKSVLLTLHSFAFATWLKITFVVLQLMNLLQNKFIGRTMHVHILFSVFYVRPTFSS